MEALYGTRISEMLLVLERRDLQDEIARLGGPTLAGHDPPGGPEGRNPDDGMTEIPYSKGAALLRLIEQTVGREQFDAYLRSYFDRHAFQSITTDVFLEDLRANLLRNDAALEQTAAPGRVGEQAGPAGQRADPAL